MDIFIKNGKRYKKFPNSGIRKLCKLETCWYIFR